MRIKEYLTDELLMIANNVTGEYSDKQIRQAKLELYNRGVNDEVIADIMEEKEEAFMKRLDAAARAEEAQINKRNEKNRNISYQWWEMIHWPDSTTPIQETMEALDVLIGQGKIRATGVSNYSVEQTAEAGKYLNVASNQVSYSMLNRGIEQELVPFALQHHLGIIAYSPMERGLLTGKYFQGSHLKENDHRNGYFRQFDLPKVQAFLETLTPMAEDKGASLSQLVLRWTTLQPGITIVLAGARDAKQAIANAQSMDIHLSPDELQFINHELAKLQL